MSTLVDPVLLIVGRLGLSALLLRAAFHKLRDVAAFRAAMADYAMLPAAAIAPAALLLIAGELALGIALLLGGIATWPAAAGTAILLSLYTLAIGINLLRRRRHIDCGCAGPAGHQRLSGHLVARNGTLVATAVALAALARVAPSQLRALTWIDAVTIAAALTATVLLYAAVESLIANAPAIAALARHHTATLDVATQPHGEQHA